MSILKDSPDSSRPTPSHSNVAVIVAARNEAAHLEECLTSLLAASTEGTEIYVVDDGSTDSSRDILRRFEPRVSVIEGEGRGPARARNLAVGVTRKPWVAFTDADCRVDSRWLEKLCERMAGCANDYVSIGGVQRVFEEASGMERLVGEFFEIIGFVSDYVHRGENVKEVSHNPTCNVLYARGALLDVGGFDESLWPCEDLDLDLRLKAKFRKAAFTPDAIVEHHRPGSWKGYLRMMLRYGFAHAQLIKKHGPCQPIHVLILLPWFVAGAHFWQPRITFFSVLALGVFTWLAMTLLSLRRGGAGFKRGTAFSGLLISTVAAWLVGFYRGVFTSRRIAAHG